MKLLGLLVLSFLALQSDAVSMDSFMPYGTTAGDTMLTKTQAAVSSVMLDLPNEYLFYQFPYNAVYVTSNGVLSLGDTFNSTASDFPTDKQLLAPFWTQYNYSSSSRGKVYYRTSVDSVDLTNAASLIATAHRRTVTLSSVVVVTWVNMRGIGSFNETNTFQCVLASSGAQTYLIVNYLTGGMQWAGSPLARVGVSSRVNVDTLPTSHSDSVLDITSTGNSGANGRWFWRLDQRADLPGLILKFSQTSYSVAEEAGSLEVCVELISGVPGEQIAITIEAQPDTANTQDYLASSYQVMFSFPVQSPACFSVSVVDDKVVENVEQLVLRLQDTSTSTDHAAFVQRQAVISIQDNDFGIVSHFNPNITVVENAGFVHVCGELVDNSGNRVANQKSFNVGLSTQPGSALENSDFLPLVDGKLEFSKDSATACTMISIQDDRVFENQETFQFQFNDNTPEERITVSTATIGTVTIEDNDGPFVQLTFDQPSYTVTEGSSVRACLQVTQGEIEGSFDIVFQTRYPAELIQGEVIPANNEHDYVGGLLSFTLDQTNSADMHCLNISTIDDNMYEGEEIFGFVVFSDTDIGIPSPRATVRLIDNDEVRVQFTADTFEFREGMPREETLICANRSGEIERNLVVQVTPMRGTAVLPGRTSADFDRIPNIVFSPDLYEVCAYFMIRDDFQLESRVETFTVGLTHRDPSVRFPTPTATVLINDNDVVTFTFFLADKSYTVDESIVPRTFSVCINREGDNAIPVSVTLMPISRTATEHEDYEVNGNSITFEPIQTVSTVDCVSVNLVVFDDPVVEGNEELWLMLQSEEPDRIKVTDPSGNPQIIIVTITDNDKVVTSFTNDRVSVSEGEGEVEVCLSLTGFTNRPFTAYLTPIEATALEGVDFIAQTVAVEFPPTNPDIISVLYGLEPDERIKSTPPVSDNQCTNISLIDDNVLEKTTSKLLLLNLFVNETGIQAGDPQSVLVTINDDDFVTVNLQTSTMTVSEDVGSVTVCADLSGSADFAISTELQISSESAVFGEDFATRTVPLVFPLQSTGPACGDIVIVDDLVLETSEELTVVLTIPTSNILIDADNVRVTVNSTLSITLTDNDFVEVVIVNTDYSSMETSETVEVCAEVVGRTNRPIEVYFSTMPATVGAVATVDVDYNEVFNASLFVGSIITNTNRVQCVGITLIDDTILEDTESFQVVLSSPDSGVVTTSQSRASVYIIDDDGVRIGIQERQYEAEENQGPQEICVELIGRIERSISIEITTTDFTATGSSDYSSVDSRALSFQSSELENQTVCFELMILEDNVYESTEQFLVSISVEGQGTSVGIHIPEATVSIIDNDSIGIGFLSGLYKVLEGEGEVELCLVLNGRTETDVECFLSTADDGEALDYIPVRDNSVLFPPSESSEGTTMQCATIVLVDDLILEPVERFSVLSYTDMPRVIVSPNETTVEILDDDSVTVGFVKLALSVNEDEQTERDVTLCVRLTGESEKSVNVTIATSSSGSRMFASPGKDYVPLTMNLLFMPTDVNKTQCFQVSVLDDPLKEPVELFDVVLSGASDNVLIPELTSRATISILDQDVVCERSSTDTSRGFFEWPEAFPNDLVRMTCINGTTTRRCDADGNWEKPDVENCFASIDAIFKHIFKNLPDNTTGLSADSLRELIAALLRLKDEEPEGLSRFIGPIYTMFDVYALNISTDAVLVNLEVYNLTVQILDILQFPEWPPHILESETTRMIRAVEIVTEGLVKTSTFDQIKLDNNYLSFLVEKGTVDDLVVQNRVIVFERGVDEEVISRLSSAGSVQSAGFLSSISLPTTIAQQLSSPNLGLYFSFYESSVMFPIAPSVDSSASPGSHVVSPVIMATVSRTTIEDLKDPVNYTIANNINYTAPICVSWDFRAAGGKGNWSTRGCELVSNSKENITCSCSHLTNFAILLDVRPVPPEPILPVDPVLSTILIVGVAISLLGLTLTVVTLLLFSKLRERDSTVLRVQFCLSIALMLLAFVCGIERVNIFELCVSISALIHYFTLVSMMWMAAESLLMLLKLVVRTKVSVAYFVVASIVCWLLPIPAVVVPIAIDPSFSIHANYCFISHNLVFYAAFLGPIAGIIIFNLILFFIGFIIILRYSGRDFKNADKAKRRRAAVRTIFVVLAIMFIFGLTWVFGAFTVLNGPDFVEYLFVIFNSLQGLFIFLIFVVFAKETRDLWLTTCGCKKRKFDDDFEEFGRLSRIVSRHSSLRKSGDELDDEYDFDFEGADRLEAMKALDREARMNMNSWDVMYIMPQNTFDIFLNSDQHQAIAGPMTEKPGATPQSPAMPSPDAHFREDQSTADSGIMVDQSKSGRSPKRLLVGDSITTVGEPLKRSSSYHIHSVSGIGYVSADSDDEFLDRASPPILASPPPTKRGNGRANVKRASSQVYGEIYKREILNKYQAPHSADLRRSNPNLPISRRANVKRSSSQVYGEIYKRELHSRMSVRSNSNLNVDDI